METYERLICDLGHCLLTKGLNNDFTERGRDLGMDAMHTGRGGGQTPKEPAENTALRIMLPDRYSKTLCEELNRSTVLGLFLSCRDAVKLSDRLVLVKQHR